MTWQNVVDRLRFDLEKAGCDPVTDGPLASLGEKALAAELHADVTPPRTTQLMGAASYLEYSVVVVLRGKDRAALRAMQAKLRGWWTGYTTGSIARRQKLRTLGVGSIIPSPEDGGAIGINVDAPSELQGPMTFALTYREPKPR